MNHRISVKIMLAAAVVQLLGCATTYGERHWKPAIVRFTADRAGVSYYLFSPAENKKQFGNDMRPLAKEERVQAILAAKKSYPADGFRTEFTQADVVVVFDCGQELRRVRVFLKGNLSETLICLAPYQ